MRFKPKNRGATGVLSTGGGQTNCVVQTRWDRDVQEGRVSAKCLKQLGQVAARRVVAVSSEIKPVIRPTVQNTHIENKAEKPALSNPKKPSSLGRFMKPEHKRMSRMLGYCLTVGTADAWSGFSLVAAARMSETERASLAFSALNSLELGHAVMTAAASIGSAGAPLPPFLGGMDEARFWASHASRSELKAYALATFEAMGATDQAAFYRHISEVEVAA